LNGNKVTLYRDYYCITHELQYCLCCQRWYTTANLYCIFRAL